MDSNSNKSSANEDVPGIFLLWLKQELFSQQHLASTSQDRIVDKQNLRDVKNHLDSLLELLDAKETAQEIGKREVVENLSLQTGLAVEQALAPQILDQPQSGQSCFRMKLSTMGMPMFVNPRATIAQRIAPSGSLGGRVHRMHRYMPQMYAWGICCDAVSFPGFVGVYPVLGYFSLGKIPLFALLYLGLNWSLFQALVRTFEFWGMLFLLVGFVGGMVDAFADYPPRICCVVMYGIGNTLALLLDARTFVKKSAKITALNAILMRFGLIIPSIVAWTLAGIWYTGTFQDVHQRIIPLPGGKLTFDVQSASMSAWVTFCLLIARHAITQMRAKDINTMVMLHPTPSYEYVPGTSDVASSVPGKTATIMVASQVRPWSFKFMNISKSNRQLFGHATE